MAGAQERLAQSVLRHLGQDAFLLVGAVSTPVRANLDFGVNMVGMHDDMAYPRDVVTLPGGSGAKLGDRVSFQGVEYVLDGVVSANGYLHRYTVTKV